MDGRVRHDRTYPSIGDRLVLALAADYVQRFSVGDIPPKITEEYSGTFKHMKHRLDAISDLLSRRTAEYSELVDASREGQLDYRADAKLFVGERPHGRAREHHARCHSSAHR